MQRCGNCDREQEKSGNNQSAPKRIGKIQHESPPLLSSGLDDRLILGSKFSKGRGQRPADSASAAETAVVEKLLFLRRRDAAENRVAVRETAEAADNIGVDFSPFQAVGIAGCLVESDTAFL